MFTVIYIVPNKHFPLRESSEPSVSIGDALLDPLWIIRFIGRASRTSWMRLEDSSDCVLEVLEALQAQVGPHVESSK